MTPEQNLWQSVVIKALADATAINPSSDEDIAAKRAANTWIRNAGRDFRWACNLAGFDPDFISEKYKAGKVDGQLLRAKEQREVPA